MRNAGNRLRAALFALGMGIAGVCAAASPAAQGYRELSPLCPPCGTASYLFVTSGAQLDRVQAEAAKVCGESKSPAQWRAAVEQARIDFSHEALVTLYEVIGTSGKAALAADLSGDGVLRASIRWEIPPGPARPVATAACMSFAVNKAIVKRVELRQGGIVDPKAPGGMSFDITR